MTKGQEPLGRGSQTASGIAESQQRNLSIRIPALQGEPRRCNRLEEMERLFPGAVFVPQIRGTKKPAVKGYLEVTADRMKDEEYRRLLERSNLAILVGPASGNLVSIDFDDDDAIGEFYDLNKHNLVNGTVYTRGLRGGNIWMRMAGEYPNRVCHIKDETGRNIGEFRGGGGLTTVHGQHPSGGDYGQLPLGSGPISVVEFQNLVWAKNWNLPWEADGYDELVRKYGEPYVEGPNSSVSVNEPFFVGKFAMEHQVLFEPGLNAFFKYSERIGAWDRYSEAAVANAFSEDIKDAADAFECPQLARKRNRVFLTSLVSQLKGSVEQAGVFERPRDSNVVHCQNGMLHITEHGAELRSFSPGYYSRSAIPFSWNTDAECPQFKAMLTERLQQADSALLQRWAGQALLGKNLSQTILIFEGVGDDGKSTIAAVISGVIGTSNTTELRTKQLDRQFESSAFIGKTLLLGSDVPGDFMSRDGAESLKKLTGGDRLSAEIKYATGRYEFRGDFNILIATNSRLVLRINGDHKAWSRRLRIISFERSGFDKVIANYSDELLRKEGDGILRWMVEGAQLLLQDLSQGKRLVLDQRQQSRVDELLDESDSIRSFVRDWVAREPSRDLPSEALLEYYRIYCDRKGFQAHAETAFYRLLRPVMLDIHGAHHSENLQFSGKRGRGYKGVGIVR